MAEKTTASLSKRMKKDIPKGVSPISGTAPPADKQFGQPEGNPRHNGAWKKEDTLRFKLQQIAKLSYDDLLDLTADPKVGEFEKQLARTLVEMTELEPNKRWQILEGLINQDGGYPKQEVKQEVVKLEPILPKEGDDND